MYVVTAIAACVLCKFQEPGYMLSDERETWPTAQSLSDFARRSCRPLAEIIVGDYFQLLLQRFAELEQRVNEDVDSAQRELKQLTFKLGEYQTSLTIGDDFVR